MSRTIVIGDRVCSRCKSSPKQPHHTSWCRPCEREYARDHWAGRSRIDKKAKWLKTKYGLTKQDYLDMLSVSGSCCYICDEHHDLDLVVDHCHTTGKVRGLLCQNCNRALGLFKEDKMRMHKAIEYVS